MESLEMNIVVSNLIDLSSTIVRGLWFKYDFFSDYCSSFNLPCEVKHIDLKAAVINEWMVKKSMTDKHIKAMKRAREEFEEKMEEKLKEEGTKKKKSDKSANEKKNKPSKVKFKEEPEPPVVDEATYVNVDEEFLSHEENLFEEEREAFSPDSLGLSKNEVSNFRLNFFVYLHLTIFKVNLREHQITNGVFKIECFERPSQTKEINFQLLLRLSVLRKEDFFVFNLLIFSFR